MVSSRFGRKPVLFTGLVLHGLIALVQAISVNWIMFCILNWLKGLSQTYSMSLILGKRNTTAVCQVFLSSTFSLYLAMIFSLFSVISPLNDCFFLLFLSPSFDEDVDMDRFFNLIWILACKPKYSFGFCFGRHSEPGLSVSLSAV